MREKRDPQLHVSKIFIRHKVGRELQAMSDILDQNRAMLDLVYDDLAQSKRTDTGREGLSAEQVLRVAVLKQTRHMSYEELAFELGDSVSLRSFAKLKPNQHPGSSSLQENIKALREETWEALCQVLVQFAAWEKFDAGRTVRIDSTALEINIHYPTDSTLLADGIRVITRLLCCGKQLAPVPQYGFSDHQRAVKRRVLQIQNAKKESERVRWYRILLEIAVKVRLHALTAIGVFRAYTSDDGQMILAAMQLADELVLRPAN